LVKRSANSFQLWPQITHISFAASSSNSSDAGDAGENVM
jgi:hypothetical protein